MSMFFNLMAAAVTVSEPPVDGQTGVWLKSGGVTISSAMKMTGAVVGSGQVQYVYNRGSALYITIESGGMQRVSSGGTARSLTVLAGGSVPVLHGGAVYDVLCEGGYVPLTVSSASASNVSQTGGNNYVFYRGGTVARKHWMDTGRCSIYEGASLTDLTVSGGGAYVISATVSGAVVSSGGSLIVSSGGTALAVTSNAGAVVTVRDGGYIEYA